MTTKYFKTGENYSVGNSEAKKPINRYQSVMAEVQLVLQYMRTSEDQAFKKMLEAMDMAKLVRRNTLIASIINLLAALTCLATVLLTK